MIIFKLRKILAENGYSIAFLSKATGVSRPTLTALANNESKGIQFDTIDTLCTYLGISIDELITHIGFDFKAELIEFNNKANYIKMRLYMGHFHFNIHAVTHIYRPDIDIDNIDDAIKYNETKFNFIDFREYLDYQHAISNIKDDALNAFIELITIEIKKILHDIINIDTVLIGVDFPQLNRIDVDRAIGKKILEILQVQQDILEMNERP